MGASTAKEIPYVSQDWAKGGDAVASRMLPPHKSATATASAVRRFGRG